MNRIIQIMKGGLELSVQDLVSGWQQQEQQ
jgi:hypothetical protein